MDATTVPVYQPPRIDAREALTSPLIGGPIASPGSAPSAAFRTAYAAPRIAARTPIAEPLVIIATSNLASG
jgi:hypothetical protein